MTFRVSDQEKLDKVVGRLLDHAVNSGHMPAGEAKEIMEKLLGEIDTLTDPEVAFILNGDQGEQPVV